MIIVNTLDKMKLANQWIEYTKLSLNLGIENQEVESLSDSFDTFVDLINNSPRVALDVILHILEIDQSPLIMSNLSAGPLEDFLVYNGEDYIQEIMLLAKQNPTFAKLLGGVWQNQMSDTIWSKVQSVWDRSGWDGNS